MRRVQVRGRLWDWTALWARGPWLVKQLRSNSTVSVAKYSIASATDPSLRQSVRAAHSHKNLTTMENWSIHLSNSKIIMLTVSGNDDYLVKQGIRRGKRWIKERQRKGWKWRSEDGFTWRDRETGKEERQNRNQHNAEGRNMQPSRKKSTKENVLVPK